MFGFRKKTTAPEKAGLFSRLRSGLSRTRHNLTDGVATLVLGSKSIDDELLEEIETTLLVADVGVEATREIIDDLTQRISRKELGDADALMQALHDGMQAILAPCSVPLTIPETGRPAVILMVGINGAGKTTTIGKLTRRLKDQGLKPMLAAVIPSARLPSSNCRPGVSATTFRLSRSTRARTPPRSSLMPCRPHRHATSMS